MGTSVKKNAPPIALASPPTRRARRASCRGSSGASRAAAASCTAPRRSARGGVSLSVDDADEGGREGVGRGKELVFISFVRYASARGGRRIHRSGDFSSETSSNDARARRRRRRRRRRGDATDDDDDARGRRAKNARVGRDGRTDGLPPTRRDAGDAKKKSPLTPLPKAAWCTMRRRGDPSIPTTTTTHVELVPLLLDLLLQLALAVQQLRPERPLRALQQRMVRRQPRERVVVVVVVVVGPRIVRRGAPTAGGASARGAHDAGRSLALALSQTATRGCHASSRPEARRRLRAETRAALRFTPVRSHSPALDGRLQPIERNSSLGAP